MRCGPNNGRQKTPRDAGASVSRGTLDKTALLQSDQLWSCSPAHNTKNAGSGSGRGLWLKAFPTKPDDLNLIPRTHTVDGKNWLPGIGLLSPHVHTCPRPYTHTINKVKVLINKFKYVCTYIHIYLLMQDSTLYFCCFFWFWWIFFFFITIYVCMPCVYGNYRWLWATQRRW